MIHVIINYKNHVSSKSSMKNAEIAKSYIDAVLRIYRHDGILEDILSIETVDYQSKEHKVVYPEVTS